MIIEAVIVGLVVGLVLGLTGAGGAIFAVPLYIILLNLPINDAIGLALGAVCIAALTGVGLCNHSRELAWRPGLILATAGMATAPLGRWLAAQINETALLIGFSMLASFLAVRMWQRAGRDGCAGYELGSDARVLYGNYPEKTEPIDNSGTAFMTVAGLLTGLLSGLFGVGGGFLVVPLLTLQAGMAIRKAIGTSLIVIALISGAGFAFHLLAIAKVPTAPLLYSSTGSIVGILAGRVIARKVAGPKLQKLFAVSVISLMAITLSRAIV